MTLIRSKPPSSACLAMSASLKRSSGAPPSQVKSEMCRPSFIVQAYLGLFIRMILDSYLAGLKLGSRLRRDYLGAQGERSRMTETKFRADRIKTSAAGFAW